MGRKAAQSKAKSTEAAANLRTFRASSDVENFYRFVHENNFRREAEFMLKSIRDILVREKKAARKASKAKRAKRKLH